MSDYDFFTAEPSPLTREERSLARLREWLGRPYWSGAGTVGGNLPWSEIVCVLAGVDPEESEDWPHGFDLLPGALEAHGLSEQPHTSEDFKDLAELVRLDVEPLMGLGLTTCAPHKAIKRALAIGLEPPWLEAAQLDLQCCAMLPREVQPVVEVTEPKERNDLEYAQEVVGRDIFDGLVESKFPKELRTKDKKVVVARVVRAVDEGIRERYKNEVVPYTSTRSLQIRIERWLEEDHVKPLTGRF